MFEHYFPKKNYVLHQVQFFSRDHEQRLFSRDCCHLSIISYRLYNMYYVFSYGLFDYCTDSRPNKKAKSSNSVSQRRAVYQKALSLKLRLRIMVVQAIYNYFYTRQYDDKKSLNYAALCILAVGPSPRTTQIIILGMMMMVCRIVHDKMLRVCREQISPPLLKLLGLFISNACEN